MAGDEIDYHGKVILAPMVRVGTLPMRLLALDYGADIVYAEEIVDRRILPCQRTVNDVLNTVDYGIPEEKYPVFRTCSAEKGKVVFQMGTCDPERALSVARLVESNVAAVDVNMGCPKAFSVQGGMGAALLTEQDKVNQILSTLVDGIHKPVTCKIRVLPKLEDTLALCSLIEKCGVKALAVHGRTKEERPRHENRNDFIREVARTLRIPVIANGGSKEIKCYDDIERFRLKTGATSVMVARSAMHNLSVLRREGLKDVTDVIDDYLRYAVKYDTCPQATKYTVQQMLQDQQQTTERGRAFLNAPPVLRDLCRVWDLEEFYDKEQGRQRDRRLRGSRIHPSGENSAPMDDRIDDGVFELDVPFIRKHFSNQTPKSILHEWGKKNGLEAPRYVTCQRPSDKRYSSTVTIQNHTFRSSSWECSKKYSEQAATLVALLILGIDQSLPEACWQDFCRIQLESEKAKFRTRSNLENRS